MVIRHQRGLSRTERRFIIRLVIVTAILLILIYVVGSGRSLLSYHRLQGQVDSLTMVNKNLGERNAQLRREIDCLQHDDAYLEELARQKYGLLKKNEMVFEFKSSSEKK